MSTTTLTTPETAKILGPVAGLVLPDTAALSGRAERALQLVRDFRIATKDDYEIASEELKAIKGKRAGLEDQRTGITGPINTALKAINNLFKGPDSLLAMAEDLWKSKMLGYIQEQERIAAEAVRKAEAIAAAERKRLEEQAAEQQRQAQEAAAAAAKAAAEGDAQAAELAKAAEARAASQAAASATEAQLVVAAPPTVERPKAAGISTSKRIDFEVTDIGMLVNFIATGHRDKGDCKLAHPELLPLIGEGDTVRIRAYVKGLGLTCSLPGVRVFEQRGMSASKS